jgi:hypothetical protein
MEDLLEYYKARITALESKVEELSASSEVAHNEMFNLITLEK